MTFILCFPTSSNKREMHRSKIKITFSPLLSFLFWELLSLNLCPLWEEVHWAQKGTNVSPKAFHYSIIYIANVIKNANICDMSNCFQIDL